MNREECPLRKELEELEALGLGDFDPSLFRLITSMATRAEGLPSGAGSRLRERARGRLAEFHRGRIQKREEAASALEAVRGLAPEVEIKAAFGQGDYREVLRLYRRWRLRRSPVQIRATSIRAGSSEYIQQRRDVTELKLRAELEESIGAFSGAEGVGGRYGSGEGDEMLSFQLFREAAAEHRAGKELGRATKEAPDNPGPLNGYALTTTALEHIRDLSPLYLKRFVKWLDGLAALHALPDRSARS